MNTTFERITAADVKVGDRIAYTRTAENLMEVTGIEPNQSTVWISYGYPGSVNRDMRVRPRYTAKLWRAA